MINQLLDEPYVGRYDKKMMDRVIKRTNLDNDTYQMYQVIFDMFSFTHFCPTENINLMATHEEVIQYVEKHIEELEREFVWSIFHVSDPSDLDVKNFEPLSLNQKLIHLGLTDYAQDRNIINLFEINAKVYKSYIASKKSA